MNQIIICCNLLKYIYCGISVPNLISIIRELNEEKNEKSIINSFNTLPILCFLVNIPDQILKYYISEYNNMLFNSINSIIILTNGYYNYPTSVFHTFIKHLLSSSYNFTYNVAKEIWPEKDYNYTSYDTGKEINHFWQKYLNEGKCIIHFINRLDINNQNKFLKWVLTNKIQINTNKIQNTIQINTNK